MPAKLTTNFIKILTSAGPRYHRVKYNVPASYGEYHAWPVNDGIEWLLTDPRAKGEFGFSKNGSTNDYFFYLSDEDTAFHFKLTFG